MSEQRELNRETLREFPLPRFGDGGKDEHGRVLIVAGSKQVPGAAMLSASAALRSGAGKVRVATVASMAPAIAVVIPEVFVIPLAEAASGGFGRAATRQSTNAAKQADALLAGPGVERSAVNSAIARALLATGKPVAFDAGMLHSLSPVAAKCRDAAVPPILLPHAGEMAALLGCEQEQVEEDRLAAARRAAEHYRAHVLAKGSTSHIAAPDGRCWTFRGGAPGLGVAGSGDTLAGIVGALLARGAEPLGALLWAVVIHGEAGEALSKRIGPAGFLAREIPDEIPALLAR